MILMILVECIIVSLAVDLFVGDRSWHAYVVNSLLAVAVVAQMLLITRGLFVEEDPIEPYVEV